MCSLQTMCILHLTYSLQVREVFLLCKLGNSFSIGEDSVLVHKSALELNGERTRPGPSQGVASWWKQCRRSPRLGWAVPHGGWRVPGISAGEKQQVVRDQGCQSWGYQLPLLLFTLCTSFQHCKKWPLSPATEMKYFITEFNESRTISSP